MKKNSFVLYGQWQPLFKLLTDADAGLLIKSIFDFAESEKVPEDLSPQAQMLFEVIRGQLERDAIKYAEICQKRKTAGAAGGRKKAENQKKTEPTEKKRKFVPPSVEEVKAYIQQKGLNVNPERFVDFYQSKNWFVGKAKMSDWQAACRNWDKQNGRNGGKEQHEQEQSFDRAQYSVGWE